MLSISDKKALSQISKVIKKSKTFFIAGHMKPDGDTIGSGLALVSLLKRLNKQPEMYVKEVIPENLKFLSGIKSIKKTDKVSKKYDCAIILECSNFDRMGNIIAVNQARAIVNIDHHINFNHFGCVNYINPKVSSSAEQVYNLFKYMKKNITKPEAECLYTGIVTDTGKFQQANTNGHTLRVASELLDLNVVPAYIYDKIYTSNRLSAIKLLGLSLSTLQTAKNGSIAYLKVTKDMYAKSKSDVTETEGIINHTMTIPGVCVGVLFREDESLKDTVKVSLRSRNGVDVNKIAGHFSGGGHKNAAGCSLKGNMDSVEKKVLKYIGSSIKIK